MRHNGRCNSFIVYLFFGYNSPENINAYTIALVTMYHSNGGSILGEKKTKALATMFVGCMASLLDRGIVKSSAWEN